MTLALQIDGKVTYNGHELSEFLPERTAVYVEQEDQHMPELTVRETFDFSACCQGVGSNAGVLLTTSLHACEHLVSLMHVECCLVSWKDGKSSIITEISGLRRQPMQAILGLVMLAVHFPWMHPCVSPAIVQGMATDLPQEVSTGHGMHRSSI